MRSRILAGAMLLTLLTIPLSANASTKSFSDVQSNHWALKPITKLANQGVLSGRGNGVFQPSEPVKNLEVLVMALRLNGLGDTADNAGSGLSKADEARFGGNVPAWGKGYFALASQKSLVDSTETLNWENGATRAWAAKVLVRLLGREADAQAKANNPISFTDAAAIPQWAKGYIVVASDLGLIRGYEDGSFQPTRIVTRAEMATLLDKTELKMSQPLYNVKQGSILQLANSGITLLENNTILANYNLGNDSIVFINDRIGQFSELKAQDQIRYIIDGSTITYLEVTQSSFASPNLVKGEVLLTNTQQGFLTLKQEDGKLETYSFSGALKVLTLLGQEATLAHVTVGSTVQCKLNSEGKITEVLLESTGQKGLEGTIVEVNSQKGLLILSNASGQYSTFQLHENVTVEYNAQRFASIFDLKKGDLVKVDTDSQNAVTTIYLVKAQNAGNVSGTVTLIAKDTRILTIRTESGELKAYEIPGNAAIQFANGSTGSIDNIQSQDTINVHINNGIVEKVVLEKTGGIQGSWGKIVSVDIPRRLLILKDKQNSLHSYELDTQVILDIEGITNPALSDLTPDTSIDYELDGEKIIYIKTSNSIKGIITRIEPDRRLISVKDEIGNITNYTIDPNVVVEIFRRSGEDLDDIYVDDSVKLRITNEKVDRIYVQTKLAGVVTDTTTSSKRIYIEDEDENDRSYDLSNTFKLVIPGTSTPNILDVKAGQGAIITYFGDTPDTITIQPLVLGEVTSVDAGHRKITVRKYDGSSTTYEANSKLKIEKSGESSSALSTVSVGDRIKLIQDDKQQVYKIFVSRKVSGQVNGINRSTKEIYLSTGSWIGYLINSDTYVLQNGIRRTFDDILQNQSVVIYYLDGLVAQEVQIN